MKNKFIPICIFICLILFGKDSFAIDKSSINLEPQPTTLNTDKNINHAIFIEKEVVSFKNKLLELEKNYNIIGDEAIAEHSKDLDEIIYILRKIQTTKVNKATAENVINIVITDVKNINNEAKQYLRIVQENDNKKIAQYNKIANNLEKNISTIVKKIVAYYQNKSEIKQEDKSKIEKLEKLQNTTVKLSKIQKNKHIYSTQYKNELIQIIKEIQTILKEIKHS